MPNSFKTVIYRHFTKAGEYMSNFVDLVGLTFGRLTVISRAEHKNRHTMWNCLCECGNTKVVESYSLKSGHIKSCGCLSVDKIRERSCVDISGKRFGKLTAIKRTIKNGNTHWICRCDCGRETTVLTNKLLSGRTTSCGCKRRPYNGESKKELYRHYRSMKSRCSPNYHNHNVYYDKGIRVCDEWNKPDSYPIFREWALKNGYKDGLSLDRINNDLGYSPDNCRWATMKEQQNNRSDNAVISYKGETHTLKEWSEILGLTYGMLKVRHRRGWKVPELFQPPMRKRKTG